MPRPTLSGVRQRCPDLLLGGMLIEMEGGFDYTAADCMGRMSDAGFTTIEQSRWVGPDSMVIGIK